MNEAYGLCTNLKSRPICGPNVQSFSYTYEFCDNLTGSDPMKCGDRISEKRYNDFMKSEAGGNIHENCDY